MQSNLLSLTKKSKTINGFSTIELIMSISIVTLISITLVSKNIYVNMLEKNAVEQLYFDIIYVGALSQNTFDSNHIRNAKELCIEFKDEKTYITNVFFDKKEITLPKDVQIYEKNISRLDFDRNRHTVGGTIKIKTSNKKYKISIDTISGNVDLVEE